MFADATAPLLIIMTPFVAGLVWLFIVKFQASAQTRKLLHTVASTTRDPVDTLGVLSIADAYDPERSVLWENQAFALKRIGLQITVAELVVLWERYMQLYPELYEETTFSDWFAFLQNCNLVESSGSVVRLTANGHDFLDCLIGNANLSRAK